jgi:Terminase large subunit, T4likevirus-type, N-terminal
VRRKSQPCVRFSDCYRAFPRQAQFHRSRAKYRLFGGAAGPGKTKALLWEAIRQAQDVPRSDSLLLRRTYPELESSLLAYFRRDVPRSMYRRYNETKHIVTWLNGSTTRFGYCRNENDVYQYQGAEFLFIGLDELTHFTLLWKSQRKPLTSRRISYIMLTTKSATITPSTARPKQRI